MGGHAARRENKQEMLAKLNSSRRTTTKAKLAKQKTAPKAKKPARG